MLAPLGRPVVYCVALCESCDAACLCCDVARRDWSSTGASAAQTPPASQQATSSACSQSDTWPVVTASWASWRSHGGSWWTAQQVACPGMGIVRSAWCTETHPGSRCLQRDPSKTCSHWSAAPGQRKPGSHVCPSESRRQGYRAEGHSRRVRAERHESCSNETTEITILVLETSLQILLVFKVLVALGVLEVFFPLRFHLFHDYIITRSTVDSRLINIHFT